MAFRFAVLALVLGYVSATKFDCITMGPIGRQLEEADTSIPFVIYVDSSKEYLPGDVVKVTVNSSSVKFDSFIIQGRLPMTEKAIGMFSVDPSDTVVTTSDCQHSKDTLISKPNQGIQVINFEWIVPGDITANEVEFDIGISASSGGKFWIFNSQMIGIAARDLHAAEAPRHPTAAEESEKSKAPVHDDEETDAEEESETESEDEGPKEDPNEPERREEEERKESLRRDHMDTEGLHDPRGEQELAKKALEKRRQEIMEEDQYSEGEWQKEAERERLAHEREIHEEEMEYERLVAEEERARQERIQAEIRDQEEYDRLPKKPQEPVTPEEEEAEIKPDEDVEPEVKDGQWSSAGRAYFSVAAMVLVFLSLVF